MESAVMTPGNTRLKARGRNSGRNSLTRLLSRNHNLSNNKNNRNASARPNSVRNYSNQRHLNSHFAKTRNQIDNEAFVNNINNGNDTEERKIIFHGNFTR